MGCPKRFPVNNAPTCQDSSASRCQRRNALWFLDSSAEVLPVKSVPQFLARSVAASLAKVAGMCQSKNVATSQDSSVAQCQNRVVDQCRNRAVVQCRNRVVDPSPSRAVDRCRSRAVSRCPDSSAETCLGSSASLCRSSHASRCRSSRARMSARMSSGARCATTVEMSTEQEEAIFRPKTRTAILKKLSLEICVQQEINNVLFSNKAFLF